MRLPALYRWQPILALSIMERQHLKKETTPFISSHRTAEWALSYGRRRAGLADEKTDDGKSSFLNMLRGIIPNSAD